MSTSRRPGLVVRLGAALALVALAVGACGGQSDGPAEVVRGSDDGMNGAVLATPYPVADQQLTDTAGRPYSLATDTGARLTLVFFGYTHCPDICQLVMANLASAMTRLDADQRAEVAVVFVTTDPARDDGPTIRAYLDRFDPEFVGLTGDVDTITSIADSMGVFIARGRRLPGGGYEVDHGTPVVGILSGAGGDGAPAAPIVWTQGTSPAAIAEDVAVLLAEGAP